MADTKEHLTTADFVKEGLTMKPAATHRRWNGEPVPDIDQGSCAYPACSARARTQTCNAEGESRRTHWHGEIHVHPETQKRLGLDGSLNAFCNAHAEEIRAAWRTR